MCITMRGSENVKFEKIILFSRLQAGGFSDGWSYVKQNWQNLQGSDEQLMRK
jgi:hypothetical protein